MLDPELRGIARILPRGGIGPRSLRVVRRLEPILERRPPPAGTDVERVGDVEVRVHRPRAAPPGPLPALLWIHGGGFVVGAPAQDDTLCHRVADRLGVVVAAVGYRRAPEHPFPAGLHDCHDALVWVAGREVVDADRVAIGGASAGGGLAASLALLARERGEVRPVLQLLTYPMLDDRTVLRTDVDERDFRLWNNGANRFGWRSYLGAEPGSANVSGLAAPARHEDLGGLPPAWIGVGTADLFHDEDLGYGDRLREAGVPCDVHVAEGAFHGFDGLRPRAGVSRRFDAARVGALAVALGVDA